MPQCQARVFNVEDVVKVEEDRYDKALYTPE